MKRIEGFTVCGPAGGWDATACVQEADFGNKVGFGVDFEVDGERVRWMIMSDCAAARELAEAILAITGR